jgi:hypothetical protein
MMVDETKWSLQWVWGTREGEEDPLDAGTRARIRPTQILGKRRNIASQVCLLTSLAPLAFSRVTRE